MVDGSLSLVAEALHIQMACGHSLAVARALVRLALLDREVWLDLNEGNIY